MLKRLPLSCVSSSARNLNFLAKLSGKLYDKNGVPYAHKINDFVKYKVWRADVTMPEDATSDLTYPVGSEQPISKTPMEMIHEVPPIEVDGPTAICRGGLFHDFVMNATHHRRCS